MKYALILLLTTMSLHGKQTPEAKKTGLHTLWNGFAVIELFTSEGCSSCPAAEEVVSKFAGAQDNIYLLSFHVDYWDRLGWKDPFSNALYSKRQQQYAGIFNLSSVYTPQIIVNGANQFVGSDEKQLVKTLDIALHRAQLASLELSAIQRPASTNVQVICSAQGNIQGELHVAILQASAVTDVRSGENHGKLLHHLNVVRDFKTGSLKDGPITWSLALPAGLSAGDCKVIAFLQDTRSGNIRGAAQTTIKLQ